MLKKIKEQLTQNKNSVRQMLFQVLGESSFQFLLYLLSLAQCCTALASTLQDRN